jgi:hypothetical protein
MVIRANNSQYATTRSRFFASGTSRRVAVVLIPAALLTMVLPARRAEAQFGGLLAPKSNPVEMIEDRPYMFANFFIFTPPSDFFLQELRLSTSGNVAVVGETLHSKTTTKFEAGRVNAVFNPFYANGNGTIRAEIYGLVLIPITNQRIPVQFVSEVQIVYVPIAATTAPPVVPSGVSTPVLPSPTNGVNSGNRPPTAQSSQVIAGGGSSREVILQASDPEANPLTFALAQFPSNGKLTGHAPKLVYTPNPGFFGTDAFSFTVSDGTATSALATVAIIVSGSKPPPAPAAIPPKSKTKKPPGRNRK